MTWNLYPSCTFSSQESKHEQPSSRIAGESNNISSCPGLLLIPFLRIASQGPKHTKQSRSDKSGAKQTSLSRQLPKAVQQHFLSRFASLTTFPEQLSTTRLPNQQLSSTGFHNGSTQPNHLLRTSFQEDTRTSIQLVSHLDFSSSDFGKKEHPTWEPTTMLSFQLYIL